MDIALIHDPDDFMSQAADDAYPALAELRAQGMIRAVGADMNSPVPLAWPVERCGLDCVLVAGLGDHEIPRLRSMVMTAV